MIAVARKAVGRITDVKTAARGRCTVPDCRQDWVSAGPGSVQLLPRGGAHSVRVPAGRARLSQVCVCAPYDLFARDMARFFAASAPLAEIVRVANRHGVALA